jgi:hypothetical protein
MVQLLLLGRLIQKVISCPTLHSLSLPCARFYKVNALQHNRVSGRGRWERPLTAANACCTLLTVHGCGSCRCHKMLEMCKVVRVSVVMVKHIFAC